MNIQKTPKSEKLKTVSFHISVKKNSIDTEWSLP